MGPFAARLSETGPTWGRAVAPLVEWVTQTLWSSSAKSATRSTLATPLTQRRKREAQGKPSMQPAQPAPSPQNVCQNCGTTIAHKGQYCRLCSMEATTPQFAQAAKAGRKASLTAEAQARRIATQRRNAGALRGWIASSQPLWLDQEAYVERILPLLPRLTVSTIALAIGVSEGYASNIRKGKCHAHPRHWQKLAELVSISADR
jgi:hypothetical protein